jgi:hypothetical protein
MVLLRRKSGHIVPLSWFSLKANEVKFGKLAKVGTDRGRGQEQAQRAEMTEGEANEQTNEQNEPKSKCCGRKEKHRLLLWQRLVRWSCPN